MSLSSTTRRNDYTGNGSVSVYAYTFRVFNQGDLTVIVRNTNDVETTLALTADFTVSGVGSASGGNVTLVSSGQAWLTAGKLTSGYHLTISRDVDLVQNTDIRNQGSFYPETHEDAFDYLTMIDQQQGDALDRSLKVPESVAPGSFDYTVPANLSANPGSAVIVNAGGTGFTLSGTLTGVPNFFRQATQPTDPAVNQLSFWFDTSQEQMNIWTGTEWRVIA